MQSIHLLGRLGLLMLSATLLMGCPKKEDAPAPQTTLGLVGGRWEVQSYAVDLFNYDPATKTLGKQRSSVTFGPGLGYRFNSDGSYDGCAMTVSDWTYPSGAPNNKWECTTKGGGGTWNYVELHTLKPSRDGKQTVLGRLTLYPSSKKPAELTYDVYLNSDGTMIWEKDQLEPNDPDTMSFITAALKLAR